MGPPELVTVPPPDSPASAVPIVRRIVEAYDDPLVRAYSVARFMILRQRFLVEDRFRDTKAYWEGEDGAKIRAIAKSD